MEELKYKQTIGEKIEMVQANSSSDLKIPAHEAHLYHVELERKEFSPETGKKLSEPYIQVFYPHVFEMMEKNNGFLGISVKILHDPTKKAGAKEKQHESKKEEPNYEEQEIHDVQEAPEPEPIKAESVLQKPLHKMNREELIAKYKELYKEAPAADSSINDLKDAIQLKMD